jgi:hypothetical protein
MQTDSGATVRTDSGAAAIDLAPRPLDSRVPAEKPKAMWFVAAAAVLAVVLGVVMMVRNRAAPAVAPAAAAQAAAVPARAAHLAINAFPWANVTAIRNADTGDQVELKEPLVTPAPIDLPPGRYEVTLANPAFAKPITKSVDLRAGGDQLVQVQFSDPAVAPLPRFGASR